MNHVQWLRRPDLGLKQMTLPSQPPAIKWKSFVYFRKQTNCRIMEPLFFEQFFSRRFDAMGETNMMRLMGYKKSTIALKRKRRQYKGYCSEVQKEIMTKLTIVRSIKMIKLINLTRTILALKTTTQITKISILYCTKEKNRKKNRPDYYCIEEDNKITNHQNYSCILLEKLFLQQLQYVWRFWLFS